MEIAEPGVKTLPESPSPEMKGAKTSSALIQHVSLNKSADINESEEHAPFESEKHAEADAEEDYYDHSYIYDDDGVDEE